MGGSWGGLGGWPVWGCWGAWVCAFAARGWGMGLGCRLLGLPTAGVFGVSVGMGFRGRHGGMSFSGGERPAFPHYRAGVAWAECGLCCAGRTGDAPTLTLPLRGRGFFDWVAFLGWGRMAGIRL